jgi:DNA-binding NarL/FixJ family response regulator
MAYKFGRGDETTERWTVAVQTFCASVKLYHRAMTMRTAHGSRRQAARTATADSSFVARSVIAVVPHELLTSRECEVAKLIARGYTNRQIAQALVVTEGTAANHVAHILSKLGVANRTQVAARMLDA